MAFKGEVVAGCPVSEVKASFRERFKKNAEAVERIFGGDIKTLANDLDFQRANSIANSLKAMGAVVYVVDNDDPVVPERQTREVAANEPLATSGNYAAIEDLSPTAKVRHLSQIMDPDIAAEPAAPADKAQKLRYRFDTFMARGGASIFKMLTAVFLIAFLIIGGARGLVLLWQPELPLTHEEIGFWGNLYVTFLELTDPGNMVQDLNSSPWYKALRHHRGNGRHRPVVRADRVHHDGARSEDQ